MNDPALVAALVAVDQAGGRMAVVGGRLRVDVDVELPDQVWQTLTSHRDELVAMLAGDRPLWDDAPAWPGPAPALPAPAGVESCDRCGATATVDHTIHGGASIRRDCATCGRFRMFVVWNGDPMP